MPDTYISQARAIRLINRTTLIRYAELGLVPQDEHGRYHLGYLQRLKDISTPGPLSVNHAKLCMLEWCTLHRPERRQEITHATKAMLEDGTLLTAHDVGRMMGYAQNTIRDWIRAGFLHSCKVFIRRIGLPAHVVLTTEAIRVKKIMDGLTSYEAAQQLGIRHDRCKRMAAKGRLAATRTPSGYRFSPESIAAYLEAQQQSPSGLALSDAVAFVGLTENIFRTWVRSGHITFTVGPQGFHTYHEASLERVKAEIETVRGGFEWLGASLYQPTYIAKVIGHRFGLSQRTIGTWAKKGFLPYFEICPPNTQQMRYYVASYIDALAAYAVTQQRPLSGELAEEFKEVMRHHCS